VLGREMKQNKSRWLPACRLLTAPIQCLLDPLQHLYNVCLDPLQSATFFLHRATPCPQRYSAKPAHWNHLFRFSSRVAACQTLSVHVCTGAVQIDEAEEDQLASASPQQPDPRESAAAEADEEGSDTEPTQVACRTLNPTFE